MDYSMNEVIVFKPVFRKVEKYKIQEQFNQLIDELKKDAWHGKKLPRKKWAINIYKKHKKLLDVTGNLWKDEIIHGHPGFRLYYTIDSKHKIKVVVLEIDPHSKTDRYRLGV